MRRPEDRHVDLLVAERDVACGRFGHDRDHHAIRVGHAGLVEFLPALGDQPRPRNVLDEFVRSKPDRMLQERVLVGLAGRIDRGRTVVQIEAGVGPLGECDFQREVVDLLQPLDRRRLTLLVLNRTLDAANVARAREGALAVHDAGIGIDDIVGGHLLAVVEEGVVAEFESVGETVVGDGHRLGEFEHRLALHRIKIVKRAVHDLAVDVVLRARRCVHVQGGKMRAVGRGHADGAAFARRLRVGLAGRQQRE